MKKDNTRPGFTLVELLVVIAIIGILVGLLLPAVQRVREAARWTSCQNNMKQVTLALLNYQSQNDKFPPGYTLETIGRSNQGHSFYYFILPILEQQNLYDQMDRNIPLNNIVASPTLGLASTTIPSLICPSDDLPDGAVPYPNAGGAPPSAYYGATSYKGNAGAAIVSPATMRLTSVFDGLGDPTREAPNNGAFMCVVDSSVTGANYTRGGFALRTSDFNDGMSNVIMLGESLHLDKDFDAAGGHAGSLISGWSRWYPANDIEALGNIFCGAMVDVNNKRLAVPAVLPADTEYVDARLSMFSSAHGSGANASFADGSVKLISDTMKLPILQLFCQRSDGATVDYQF